MEKSGKFYLINKNENIHIIFTGIEGSGFDWNSIGKYTNNVRSPYDKLQTISSSPPKITCYITAITSGKS